MRLINLIISLFVFSNLISTNLYAQSKNTVKLEVVRAFDFNLPIFSDQDFSQILIEAKKIIYSKLGRDIEIQFQDNGIISLDELFHDSSYQTTEIYETIKDWKYNFNSPPDFTNEIYKKYIIQFLEQWNLNDLKSFYPNKKIDSYTNFYKYLTATYNEKIRWLLTLKKENGSLVISKNKPYHSNAEWIAYMYFQDKYDIIFTNTLIIADDFSKPYPHVICKHSKIGGHAFISPKRKQMDGSALLVNIFEQYGQVKGICEINNIPIELKNRILGGFYFAHEFGHAFYRLPDVYDHGDTCIMNTTLSNMDDLEGYKLLISDLSPCNKCRPWVIAKEYVVLAKEARKRNLYSHAADLFIMAAGETPEHIAGDYKSYIEMLVKEAKNCYERANNQKGISTCNEIINLLNSK